MTRNVSDELASRIELNTALEGAPEQIAGALTAASMAEAGGLDASALRQAAWETRVVVERLGKDWRQS